jgi:hypothetical protein
MAMTLDLLMQQLHAAHGDNLRGVVVYGSTAANSAAARGHNVLVVVRTLDMAGLQASGAIAQAWHEAGNPAPLTMTEAEWRSSRDVFAIEHADIAARHRVLHAADGFAIPAVGDVKPADLRHQLEYEVLSLTLGVRSAIAGAGRDARAQRAVLADNASRAVALLRAVLRMEQREVPADAEAVCAAAEGLTGVPAGAFVNALKQRAGNDIPKTDVGNAVGAFHESLAALVAWVDARPTAS